MNRSLYVGCADWTSAEFLSAAGSLLRGQAMTGGNDAKLRLAFEKRYGFAAALPVNSGRTAITLILNALRKRAPARLSVVIPAYTCPSLPQAVEASGLRPIGVDIGDDLNISPAEMAAAIDADTLAVVAPHMYGCPAPIAEIEALCRSRGVFLVDDAAQVVGVTTGGRQLGSFGDFGIVSFAQSKAVVAGMSGAGGMLLVNDPALVADVASIVSALPRPAKRFRAYLQFAGEYLLDPMSADLSYYFLRAMKAVGLIADSSILTPARISNFEAGIALQQLDRLPAVMAEKMRVATLYAKHLDAAPGFAFPQFAEGRFLSRFMLRGPAGESGARLRDELKARHIHTRCGYPTFAGGSASVPRAIAASTGLIEAPFHRGIDEASIRHFFTTLAEISR